MAIPGSFCAVSMADVCVGCFLLWWSSSPLCRFSFSCSYLFWMIYAPIMRTWSSGMEEQFYLVWPAILLLCGLGVSGGSRPLGRRWIAGLELLAASLLL